MRNKLSKDIYKIAIFKNIQNTHYYSFYELAFFLNSLIASVLPKICIFMLKKILRGKLVVKDYFKSLLEIFCRP